MLHFYVSYVFVVLLVEDCATVLALTWDIQSPSYGYMSDRQYRTVNKMSKIFISHLN